MSTALASQQGALNPLKAADPKDVLNRVLNEESTKDIAASLGVTRSALNQWLLATAETEWKTAQVIRASKRKDEAEDHFDEIHAKIATADKEERDRLTLTLSLAREKLKAAQWDLERVCRRIYGQDQPPAHASLSISLNFGTNQAQANVVDAEVIDETKR
jgi:membrane-bound lytic murein transglycosylase B